LSPLEAANRAGDRAGVGSDAFVRQLAWRDFHHQVLAARPDAVRRDYRPRGDRWQHSDEELAAWREGRTGYPIVDAGMRQLALEGWMHNRARLITAHFLTKTLYIDWRLGAAHFLDLPVVGMQRRPVGTLELSGSTTAVRDSTLATVYSQCYILARNHFGGFTAKSLTPAIEVRAGQVIQVKVVFSFS